MFGFFRNIDLVSCVKQRLRWNATAIQTNAAEPFLALDEDDFFAEVGGIKRRRVSARPRADNDDLSFDRVHEKSVSKKVPPSPRPSPHPPALRHSAVHL